LVLVLLKPLALNTMTVSEMIVALQQLPPDLPVVVEYDDMECGELFTTHVKVCQETLKVSGDRYHRVGPYVRMRCGKQVELPFTREEVVLLTAG